MNFLCQDIGSEEGRFFVFNVMDFIHGIIAEIQAESGDLINLEATPSEITS